MDSIVRRYYGDNYDKAMKNLKAAVSKARSDLIKKYPYATITKFEFSPYLTQHGDVTRVETFFINSDTISTDITSTTFKNDKSMWKWLHKIAPFPKIWSSGGTLKKLHLTLKNSRPRNVMGDKTIVLWFHYPDYVLDYQVHNFDVYVDDTHHFKSNLPIVYIDTKPKFTDENGKCIRYDPDGSCTNREWTLRETYYQAIAAMYIATYKCGVSLEHLTPSADVPKQITSLMRFHVYFTMRRVMFRLSKGGRDVKDIIRLYVPNWRYLREHLPRGGKWADEIINVQSDYKRYCLLRSNGITDIGQQLINQSIEVYMYAILGSQAKAKQSIIGTKASTREVQQVFRNIVEDAVVQYSPSVWINLMNRAIRDTHVKLDTSVTPNTWLIPRSMILLKTPVLRYNNLLRTSSDTGMSFGYNDGLNYKAPSHDVVKKVHQDTHELMAHKVTKKVPMRIADNHESKEVIEKASATSVSNQSELTAVLVVGALSGLVISKYVL